MWETLQEDDRSCLSLLWRDAGAQNTHLLVCRRLLQQPATRAMRNIALASTLLCVHICGTKMSLVKPPSEACFVISTCAPHPCVRIIRSYTKNMEFRFRVREGLANQFGAPLNMLASQTGNDPSHP